MGGGKGGSSGNTTTVQKADPWSGIQPELLQAAHDTQNLYKTGQLKQNYFPGSTVASQSPWTQQAQGMLANRALSGSPVNNAASGLLTDTLNGKYLDPNSDPYLDATYNKAAQAVTGSVNSAFGQGGRYGSGLNQLTLGKALGDTATSIYGQNYQDERNRQQQGILEAPQTANQDYQDIGQLANAGANQDAFSQANLDSNINRWNFNQNQPTQQIQSYLGLLNGTGVGNSTQTQTPYFSNPAGSGLGGAITGGLAGSSLFSSFPQTLGSLGLTSGTSGLLGGGLGLLGGLLSDARFKENIHLVEHQRGIPIYIFNYIDDPKNKYMGVMAQDIIDICPQAVSVEGAHYVVDYAMLGIEFKRIH